jgi:hypothetical protein
MEAFRDALTELGREFTPRAFSEEQAPDLVLWLAFAPLDCERKPGRMSMESVLFS